MLVVLENIPFHIKLLHSQNRGHALKHIPMEKVDVSSLVSIVNGHVPRSCSFVRKNKSVLPSASAPIEVMHEPISWVTFSRVSVQAYSCMKLALSVFLQGLPYLIRPRSIRQSRYGACRRCAVARDYRAGTNLNFQSHQKQNRRQSKARSYPRP